MQRGRSQTSPHRTFDLENRLAHQPRTETDPIPSPLVDVPADTPITQANQGEVLPHPHPLQSEGPSHAKKGFAYAISSPYSATDKVKPYSLHLTHPIPFASTICTKKQLGTHSGAGGQNKRQEFDAPRVSIGSRKTTTQLIERWKVVAITKNQCD